MDGPGFPTNPGAGRLITMDAGSFMAGTGAGGRAQSMQDMSRFGPRLTCPSLGLVVEVGE